MKKSSALHINISVETEIILPNCNLSTIISTVKKEIFAIAIKIISLILIDIDKILLKEKPRNVRICKLITRTIQTSFGEVTFHYRQVKVDKHYCSPLLELIGLGRYERVTEDVLELPMNACIRTSYRNAAKISEFNLSVTSLWRYLQKCSAKYIKSIDDALYCFREGDYSVKASDKDFAIVMIDEIWIRGRRKKQWVKVKTARLKVTRHKFDDTYECEPVCVFAGIASQEAFLKKAVSFFDAQKGLNQIQNIIVITDGCSMGRKFCEFYPKTAKWQLDWWHLWDKVNEGCSIEKKLNSEIWDLLNTEKPKQALKLLKSYLQKAEAVKSKLNEIHRELNSNNVEKSDVNIEFQAFYSEHKLQKLRSLITYIQNNIKGIYAVKSFVKRIPAEYLFFGSGPVERLQAVMIAYRMKKQGKHWSKNGANNMVALLVKEWNGDCAQQIIDDLLSDLKEWKKLEAKGKDLSIEADEKVKRKKPDTVPESNICVLNYGKVTPLYKLLKSYAQTRPTIKIA